jgi:uncharacterized membrane protein
MLTWLRRRFVTGLFLTIPLVVSVVALGWLIQFADARTARVSEWLFGFHVYGAGIVVAALAVLLIGIFAANVMGQRIVASTEGLLMHVPVFRTVYGPIKQLIEAFSPDNAAGFKRVVLIDDASRGLVLGFLTREFTADRGHGPEPMLAVYVPTNHLYLGDVLVVPRERAVYPDLTVEQGLRVFLTGGVALPDAIDAAAVDAAERQRGRG